LSTDKAVTEDIMKVLEDGREGFAKAADKLDETNAPDLAVVFRRLGAQRAAFITELNEMAKKYGDDADASGSVAAKLHRGWMAVKDAFAGSDPDGVLDAAEQGEDHAVKEYGKALDADISPSLRTLLQRQFDSVRAAHDEVKSLRNHAESRR
jgi:uncharacterized protein (TIGR02284 family)